MDRFGSGVMKVYKNGTKPSRHVFFIVNLMDWSVLLIFEDVLFMF